MNLGAVECTEGLFKVRLEIYQFLIIYLAPIKSIDSKVAYLLNLAAKSTNRYNLIQKSMASVFDPLHYLAWSHSAYFGYNIKTIQFHLPLSLLINFVEPV